MKVQYSTFIDILLRVLLHNTYSNSITVVYFKILYVTLLLLSRIKDASIIHVTSLLFTAVTASFTGNIKQKHDISQNITLLCKHLVLSIVKIIFRKKKKKISY